jgi:hypothetical protein
MHRVFCLEKLKGRRRRRWKDNIRMDLREVGWKGVDWIHIYQDRDQWQALVTMVMISLKGLGFLEELSDYLLLKKEFDAWSELISRNK